jgi:transposase
MNAEVTVYCGIDVSKEHLDARIKGKTIRFSNTVKGAGLIMDRAGEVHFIFESTGGYERMAAWMMMAAGKKVSIVNPGRVRHFAISMGQLAKTDNIDARIITEFAEQAKPAPAEKPSKSQRTLTALVDRRQQLVEIRTAETSRLDTAGDPIYRKLINRHLKWLNKEIAHIEEEIGTTITEDTEMAQKAQSIQRLKGLGAVCTSTLLAHLPEIGTLSRQEIAALAGVAPYNRDSGKTSFRRHICGGRKRLRACLYMAAVCAIRYNDPMKKFYTRLVEVNHRPPKVALVAVMRKLLIAANSAVKNPDFILVV